MTDLTLVAVVAVALFFDFTNGFHDTANSIATSVSTRAVSPRAAVAMAAVLNFLGAFASIAVAATIAKGIVDPEVITLDIVLAGLTGAITWNLITWYFGLPSSSSHALIGGLVGSALAAVGVSGVQWAGILDKVVIPMVISPVVGFGLAFVLMVGIMWVFKRRSAGRVNRGFRLAQTASAAAMALGHGLQDAQKTMGVIFLALVTYGSLDESDAIPVWVIVAAATAISLGTYSGGWRVMRTLGRRIIHLDPPRGFAAETTAASVLYVMAMGFGAPISTTHTITSSVMGVGATKRLSAVRWGIARSIVIAWVLTIPAAALAAAGFYWLAHVLLEVLP
jgi:PiT family inorganic phosphate transporter